MAQQSKLTGLRKDLDKMRDGIVFGLLRRSDYHTNEIVYLPGGIPIKGFKGSLFDYLLIGREKLDGSAGRWSDSREHPFFPSSTAVPLRVSRKEKTDDIIPNFPSIRLINRNEEIIKMYGEIVNKICESGDQPEEYGSVALLDISCVEDLSTRIHYGEFIAESKLKANETDPNGKKFVDAIWREDWEFIRKAITDEKRENIVFEAVRVQALKYSEDPETKEITERGKKNADLLVDFYKNKIIPLTKEVELEYLRKNRRNQIYNSFG